MKKIHPYNPNLLVKLIISLLFLLQIDPTFAADSIKSIKHLKHKIWRYEQGLPFNTITSVAQTKDNYMWFGSKEGLIRFDGVNFTLYSNNNVPEFENNAIWKVLADSKGGLWIGTDGGLLYYKDNKFKKFTELDGLPTNVIWTISEDPNGSIWVGTGGGGVRRYSEGKFIIDPKLNELSSGPIWAIYNDKNGDIWFGTDGEGLKQWHNGRVISHTPETGFPSPYVFSICEDNDGNLLFGTTDGLIKRINNKFLVYTKKNGLSGKAVWSINKSSDGSIWLGIDGGGLTRLSDDKFEQYTTREGLSSDFVSSIFEDSENNVWVGTKGGGINRFYKGLITCLTSDKGELANDFVYTIYEDKKGTIWIGSNNGLYYRSNIESGFSKKDEMENALITSLAEDKNGNLWMGTDGAGVFRLSNGKIRKFTQQHGLASNSVWTLLVDDKNNLWIGTDGGGLNLFRNDKFHTIGAGEGIPSSYISSIIQDKKGTIWIGTREAGIYYMKDGIFTQFNNFKGTLSNSIRTLFIDDESNLWIVTNEGLNRYYDGKIYNYKKEDGLYDNVIYSVIREGDNLWMTGNRGIFTVRIADIIDFDNSKIKKIPCTNFGVNDGMETLECTNGSPAAFRTKDGKLWFATIKGAVYLDPNETQRDSYNPEVLIGSVMIDSSKYDHSAEIIAKPGSGNIEIDYTTINFTNPEDITFRYKLEGYDPDWVDAGSRRIAMYTNIPPGEYVFHIQAGLNNKYSGSEKSIRIILKPHFWQTLAFRITITLLVILIAYLVFLYRIRVITKQNKKLDMLVNQRTLELKKEINIRIEKEKALAESEENLRELNKSKDKFFSIVSHDLRSPFQGLLGITGALVNEDEIDPDEVKTAIHHLHNQAHNVYNFLNNLLEWSRLQRGIVNYSPENLNLFSKITEVTDLLSRNAHSKNISIETDIPKEIYIYADSNMLSSIFNNLLSNAIKFTRQGGNIWIFASVVKDEIQIKLRDNGIGMSEERVHNLFKIDTQVKSRGTDNEAGSGLGLILCQELVEKNNGKISVESELDKGSTFLITLPKGRNFNNN